MFDKLSISFASIYKKYNTTKELEQNITQEKQPWYNKQNVFHVHTH